MKSLLFAMLLLTCKTCVSQKFPDYCVYIVKGEVTITKDGLKPVRVKQKQLLYKNEVLSLSKNAEVTLINKDDKLLVWNTMGSIKVNDLALKFKSTAPSVTKNYLDLAFHELLDPNYDYASFKQKNVGGIKGGVSRSDGCNNLIFPVKGLKTSADSILFRWYRSGSSNDYTFLIYDSFAREIVKMEIRDTQYVVNLRETLKSATGKYYWVVKVKSIGCEDDPIGFEIMNKEDESKLIPALILQKGDKDVLSQLQIVDELEKDKWIYSALRYYAAVLQKNRDDEPLMKSYILFLLKYGFDDEAYRVWKDFKTKM